MDLHSESQRTTTGEAERRSVDPAPIAELADYQRALSMHVGEALVNIDTALLFVNEERWTPETQAAIRREIGAELISGFIEGSGLAAATPRSLEAEARLHLARFVIVTSLLTTEREKRARVGESPACSAG